MHFPDPVLSPNDTFECVVFASLEWILANALMGGCNNQGAMQQAFLCKGYSPFNREAQRC
jgi:hypothetical protein